MTHDHEHNCPPKLENAMLWVWTLIPAMFVAAVLVDLAAGGPRPGTRKDCSLWWRR